MKNLQQLLEILDKTPKHMIMHVALSQLLKPVDWNTLLANYIEELSDENFFATVDKMHIPNVDPRVFMIHEKPGFYQIVVHHFDLKRFNHYMTTNRIGAHFHHFSFATRIIRGGYSNILFENHSDSLTKPNLEAIRQNRCERGSVYGIDYRQFHCVFKPENDSMSLMIRTKPELDPGHSKEVGYDRDVILTQKAKLISLLKEPFPVIRGALDEYEDYNPAKILGMDLAAHE
jgi:hypothetical protein